MKYSQERSREEAQAISMFAAQGCTVLKFWIDEDGYGHAEVRLDYLDGSIKNFSQNPKDRENND